MDLLVESYAKWHALRASLVEERSERLSDEDAVDMLYRHAMTLTGDRMPGPPVQTAMTTCKVCKESVIEVAGEALRIDAATAARLACDTVHIGDLESDERTRLTSAIPEAIRRKVFHRDHFACAVPGCRSTRYLDIHHLRPRAAGGDHSMSNLLLTCAGCHKRHHEGSC